MDKLYKIKYDNTCLGGLLFSQIATGDIHIKSLRSVFRLACTALALTLFYFPFTGLLNSGSQTFIPVNPD